MKTIAKRALLLIVAVAAIGFAGTTSASAHPYYHNGYYYHHQGYYGYHRNYYGYNYGQPYGHWGYNNGVRVWIAL